MKLTKLMILIVAVCIIATLGVQADDSVKQMKATDGKAVTTLAEKKIEAKTTSQIAKIIIPDLVPEKAKKFVEVLKGIKGVQAVKPDQESGSMYVTYDSKVEFKKLVMPKLQEIDPKVKLESIKETKNVHKGKCGGCPNKAKCAGAKQAEAKPGEIKPAACTGVHK